MKPSLLVLAFVNAFGLGACDATALDNAGADLLLPLEQAPDLARAADLFVPFQFDGGIHFAGLGDGGHGDEPFPVRGSLDPNVTGAEGIVTDGVGPDSDGNLVLNSVPPKLDYLWVANTNDWNRGTVSRIDVTALKEAARYLSVTCYSNFGAGASKALCDGTNGCCAGDDFGRYSWRQNGGAGPKPKHQAIDQNNTMPSRTAIDYSGDLFVANRAFNGQSSVTRIANSLADCRDYNGNKKIDTSSDVNGDGLIQTDCNDNGALDDIDDVRGKACLNGMKQEFYGLDDECVLWTTNTNLPRFRGRPLTLGPGGVNGGPSDVWAGTWLDGKFFRLEGATGLTLASVDTPSWTNAYGAAIDAADIIWVVASDGPNAGRLGYFDANNPWNTGLTRAPPFPIKGYGISVDGDQNIWEGGYDTNNVYRYAPDRRALGSLGAGGWTRILTPGASTGATGYTRGIAVDLRGGVGGAFFAWVASDGIDVNDSYITRIPASLVPLPGKVDNTVDGSLYPSFKVGGLSLVGVGVDRNQNIWGVSLHGSVITRARVDGNGTFVQPIVGGAGKGCPVGDQCVLKDNANSDPQPYTYSNFTGFGLGRQRVKFGTYSFYVLGCRVPMMPAWATDTQWWTVAWDAEVPLGTSLSVHVRAGEAAPYSNDPGWGPWIPMPPATTSPLLLRTLDPSPGGTDLAGTTRNGVLELEFIYTTKSRIASPKLKSVDIAFKCSAAQ